MTEKKTTPETEEKQEETMKLTDCFPELEDAFTILIENEGELFTALSDILIVLIEATKEKLKYYTDTYGFRIRESDNHSVPNLVYFLKNLPAETE